MSTAADPAKEAIELCTTWAKEVRTALPTCKVYLFGSTIYDNGDQFDAEFSDLDLVVLFTDDVDAATRVDRLKALRELKLRLELNLIPRLHRTICVEPGVSIVVLTPHELSANIHKSSVRRFFDRNVFLNLETGGEEFGLSGAGMAFIPDENRHALEHTQKVRNEFLGEAANGTGGLKSYDGYDPLPKALTRAAAQLRSEATKGQLYDTRQGLELLFDALSRARDKGELFEKLFSKVSKRRGGRGHREALTPSDQLLLAEMLHEMAAATAPVELVTWQIRLIGAELGTLKYFEIMDLLKRLAPEAEITKVLHGSIVVELRTSQHSYHLFLRFSERGVLEGLFDVDQVELSEVITSEGYDPFKTRSFFDALTEYLTRWRPVKGADGYAHEASLGNYLNEFPSSELYAVIADEVRGQGRHRLPYDFRVVNETSEPREAVGIEVTRFSSNLYRTLTGLLSLDEDIVLVVIAPQREAPGLEETRRRLEAQRSKVRLVIAREVSHAN